MTREEFTNLTGLKVDLDQYDAIEKVYMASGDNVPKDVFCADIKKLGGLTATLAGLYNTINALRKRVAFLEMNQEGVAHMLICKSDDYCDSELYEQACQLIGEEAAMTYKLTEEISLTDTDREYLINLIQSQK